MPVFPDRNASLIGEPLRALVEFEGTATDLLRKLATIAEDATRTPGWPRSPQALGNALRRLAPSLRATGVDIDYHRSKNQRTWIVRTVTPSPVTNVTAVTGDDSDDTGDDPCTLSRTTTGSTQS